jgi:hypothetical protein
MDIKNFKINCSSIGALMGNAQGNNPITDKEFKDLISILERDYELLSETQKYNAKQIMWKQALYEPTKLSDTVTTELAKIYSFEMYGKSKVSKGNDSPQQLEKGNLAEPMAIKMLSDIDGIEYTKNEELFQNKWLKGIPDILIKTPAGKIKKIIELKVAYDLPTFLISIMRKEESSNILETMGYMDIIGCNNAEIVHLLVDMPEGMIAREELKAMEFYSDLGIDREVALKRLEQRKNSMVFPEFPLSQKIYRQPVVLNKLIMKDVKRKVTKAKEWIAKLDAKFTKPLSL